MLDLNINNSTFPIPQSWNDIDEPQLLDTFAILNDAAYGVMPPGEVIDTIRMRLFCRYTGLPIDWFEMWMIDASREYPEDPTCEIRDVLKLFDWVFEKTDTGRAISTNMYRSPFRTIIGKDGNREIILHGPDDEMSNLTFGELVKVFTCAEAIVKDDENAIDELVATLYRPIDEAKNEYALDRRQDFVGLEHLVKSRVEWIRHLDPIVKDLLAFWAACIYKKYTTEFENLFQEAKKQGETVGNDYSWAGLILALSSDVTKVMDVMRQQADDAFVYMSYLEDARKREESALKKKITS